VTLLNVDFASIDFQEVCAMRSTMRFLLLRVLLVSAAIAAVGAVTASAGTEKILLNFSPLPHGYQPNGALVQDAAGNLYGVTWLGGAVGVGGVYKVAPNSHGGWTETMIYSFPYSATSNPQGGLVFDAAGDLYGTAGNGAIFKLTPKATGQWTETTIWTFSSPPSTGMVFDKAGNLYGAASGGAHKCGQVFRLTPQSNGSWTESAIYSFQCGSDGSGPNGGPIFDQNGDLYGAAGLGGASGQGVVYELTQSGGVWTEQVLYSFTGGAGGVGPGGPLTFDGAGNIYGVAGGGSGTGCFGSGCGVVFELMKGSNGTWTETPLHDFNWTDGAYPAGGLVIDEDGNVYGSTDSGGTADFGNAGTVFELIPGAGGQWTQKVLWNFTGGKDGAEAEFGVVLGAGGKLYGPTKTGGGLNGNGTVFELTPTASGPWKETTITNMADGNGGPEGGLAADGAGNYYGTTVGGGANGFGVIYEISPAGAGKWTITILYNFATGLISQQMGHGASASNLIFDAAGNLYGETGYGGATGNGLVFELSPGAGGSWVWKDLYDFQGGVDGSLPLGGVILDGEGNLYGTTKLGGSGTGCHRSGCGTVFELSPSGGSWSKTILYNFAGGPNDGENPLAGLVFDRAGNLYGTTVAGGSGGSGQDNCGTGCGSVFELSPSSGGWKETVLHSFTETHGDGALPEAGLILDGAGNLYGTTYTGGSQDTNCSHGCGTVFELSPVSGGGFKETVIYALPGPYYGPLNALVSDSSGNLYGTTTGSVFELSPVGSAWNATTLYVFGGLGSGDGSYPLGTLILDGAGNLYGTTPNGGASNGGTVFEITP
jgi:uncharacterized repeat protein (TIGR03803 family)